MRYEWGYYMRSLGTLHSLIYGFSAKEIPTWYHTRPRGVGVSVTHGVTRTDRYTICNPYKHRTGGPPAASHLWSANQPSATGWLRVGLQGGPPAAHPQQATTEPTVLSSYPPLRLLIFHFTDFGGQQPTSSRHSANPSGTGSASGLKWLAG